MNSETVDDEDDQVLYFSDVETLEMEECEKDETRDTFIRLAKACMVRSHSDMSI